MSVVKEEKGSVVAEDVSFEEIKNENKNSGSIDFASEEDVNSHIKQPVKDTTSRSSADGVINDKSEPITPESIREAEDKYAKNFTEKDASQTARFLITAFDTAMRMLFKFIGKGAGDDDSYRIQETDKNDLCNQLTILLVKYQAKFPIAFIFLLTVLAVYSTGFQRALKHRQLATDSMKIIEKEIEIKKEEKGVDDLSQTDINKIVKDAKKEVADKDIQTRANRKARKANIPVPQFPINETGRSPRA